MSSDDMWKGCFAGALACRIVTKPWYGTLSRLRGAGSSIIHPPCVSIGTLFAVLLPDSLGVMVEVMQVYFVMQL
eukprot:scaffold2072_cov162-Amphora_coffeaeformis.AAC.14